MYELLLCSLKTSCLHLDLYNFKMSISLFTVLVVQFKYMYYSVLLEMVCAYSYFFWLKKLYAFPSLAVSQLLASRGKTHCLSNQTQSNRKPANRTMTISLYQRGSSVKLALALRRSICDCGVMVQRDEDKTAPDEEKWK